MKVGLNFTADLAGADQHAAARLFSFVLELSEEADRLGADALWYSEHHVWEGGHMAQPLAYCAAVAARTSRIRIGTGIMVPAFTSAVQVAEEATLVDLLSGGRLDLGLGAGYSIPEFELFGVDIRSRYDALDRRAQEIRTLWEEGKLTPAPIQDPVPIWMGYQGVKGAYRAGKLGEGLLSADARNWDHYRSGLLDGGHELSRARMAGAITGWVTDDPERDWPEVAPHVAEKFELYKRAYVQGRNLPVPRPVDPNWLRQADMALRPLTYFLHATPEESAKKIKEYVGDAPVEEVHINFPVAGLGEGLVLKEVQTICTRLAPLLR